MTELLLRALFVGLSSAGLVVILRATPLVQRLVFEGKKPWACDTCMSFWSTLLVAALAATRVEPLSACSWSITPAAACFSMTLVEFAAAPPGFAVTLLTLRKLTEPLRPPRELPELEDSE